AEAMTKYGRDHRRAAEVDARSDRRRKLTLNAEARSVDVRLHTAGIVDRWIEIQLHARLLGDRAQQITQPSECGQKKLRPEQQPFLVIETTKAAADDRARRLAR